KFDFEYRYRFINIKVEFKLPDCRIAKFWFQSQQSHYDTLYFYNASRNHDILPNSDAYTNINNEYSVKFGHFYSNISETTTGTLFEFDLDSMNSTISNMNLHTCQFFQSGNIEGFDN